MRTLLASLFILGSTCAHAITPVKVGELFSNEKNPGLGKLVYTSGEKTETIEFGGDSGHFGMGLVFTNKVLPESVIKDLKGDEIVQIVMGTQRGKIKLQVPQFSSATLISRGISSTHNSYKLTVPSGSGEQDPAIALLLFTSPQTASEQSDEDKLKSTFFAQSGRLTVVPKGRRELLSVRYQGKNINFNVQTLSVTVDAHLVTPFNSLENTLKGEIEFPVYSPKGKAAEDMLRKIAADSLGGLTTAPVSEAISSHRRDVAGSPAKK